MELKYKNWKEITVNKFLELQQIGKTYERTGDDDLDAINMAKRIAKEFGLGIGISSGANFLASVIMDNSDLKIATVFPDDNKKYITTKLSEEIDENPELLSNKIKLISIEVI